MKIAIIGTHSTGKTTLVNKLCEYLKSQGKKVILLPEMARLCPYPINNGTSHEAQQWILKKQIDEENLIDDKDAIIICDRGAIDTVAYYYRFCQRTNALDQIAPWEEMMANHTPSYDLLFKTQKLPILAVEDGQRDTDEGFREEIDVLLADLLQKHAVRYVELPATTDYDTHINFISDFLEKN